MRFKKILFLIPIATLLFIGSFLIGRNMANQYDYDIAGVENHLQTTIIEPKPIPLEEQILSKMTDEEKVGQLFIYGIDGNTTLNPENKHFLIETKPGGIILFSKNITDEEQLKTLIAEIQSTNPNIPLFISIDQEGGVVSRLRWNDTLTKSQSSVKTPQEAYDIAKSRGEMLRNSGINMNLAPVAEFSQDTHSFIFNRTYSGNIEEVTQKIIYSVKGYRDSKIISVLKHFPGHGETHIDPHSTLPSINISEEQWNEYVMSFSESISQESIDAIMIGHIFFPNISNDPATISKEIITNRLIDDIGYTGLIISDDMEMMALSDIDTPGNLAVRSVEAGMDILIYSRYSSDKKYSQRVAYDAILDAIREGSLDIDEHVLKILRTKLEYVSSMQ